MAAPSPTILHLIDTAGPGGAETIFLNLVTAFDAPDCRSIAVVPQKDWLWGALEDNGFSPILLPSHGSFDLGHLRGIAQLARKYDADLIQAHLFSSSVYASLAAISTGVPVVCTFHGQNDVAAASYRTAKFGILRRRANRYVFVSQSLRRWFLEHERMDPKRSRVIYNGIDCSIFKPRRDADARRQLGATADDVLVGAVGNLRTPKDYPTFLRSAALLLQRSPRYRFVIVGSADEPIRSQLEALSRELNLGDRLMLAGFRDNIERVMNALDVYVLSSSSEGFSLTTVQAMASGVPVVATRCGGPEEIIVDEESGVLVPTGEPASLARAIDALANDAEKRMTLANAARARALRHFSIDSMIHGYSALYQECLAKDRQVAWQLSS